MVVKIIRRITSGIAGSSAHIVSLYPFRQMCSILLCLCCVLYSDALAGELVVNDKTPCNDIVNTFDSEHPDKENINLITKYVTSVFIKLDSERVRNGNPVVWAKHSNEGRYNDVALVVAYCRKHASSTLKSQVIDVYAGIKAMDHYLLGAPESRTLARRSRRRLNLADAAQGGNTAPRPSTNQHVDVDQWQSKL
jgi:hypothetical protein